MATASDVVQWMKRQVGVAETPLGSNNVIFNTNYYGRPVSGNAYAWCQAMIWDCFRQLGISNLYGTKSAYTVFVASAFNQQGRFHKWNTTPQPGDMVFYDWQGGKSISGVDHVGIVESVNGDGTINTIEGNVSNKVMRLRRQRTYMVGFARPAYGATGGSGSSSTGSNTGSGKTYTVKAGDTLWGISQREGASVSQLKEWNNLAGDLILVGQTLRIGSGVVTPPSGSNVQPGGNSVMKLCQAWLNNYSFNNITVDGVWGANTKTATVKTLQHELNKQYGKSLIVDGVWGSASTNAFPVVRSGAQGNLTRCIQILLTAKGYNTNGFDGIYGGGTLEAVQQFQRASGLAVDGSVGKDTISRLIA